VKFITLALILIPLPVFAQTCDDFSGDYINLNDTARPEIKIRQSGCESITLTDNSGVDWLMQLDGTSNKMPKGLPKEFYDVIADGSYTVTRSSINELKITARAKLNVEMPDYQDCIRR
jgi:hypothetical protein